MDTIEPECKRLMNRSALDKHNHSNWRSMPQLSGGETHFRQNIGGKGAVDPKMSLSY